MDRQKSGQTDKNAKFRLMTAMFIFGTIGIFVVLSHLREV